MDVLEKPPFTKRERMIIDSKVEVKYPEKTWSVEQSYRDIYQNHLDAQVKLSVDGLLADIAQAVDADRVNVLQNDGLRKVAYEYLATKGHTPREIKDKMVDFLTQNITGRTKREPSELAEIVETHNILLPKVEVLARDDHGKETWVDKDSLELDPLRELRIVGFRISDDGGGYDANLKTIFYSSGKDSPDQVGKFGEGGKMSEILLQQKGFRVESRSAYSYDDKEGHHDVLWKGLPRVSKEGSMEMQVTQVELSAPIPTGSVTEVVFRNPDIQNEDLEQILMCVKSLEQPQIIFDNHRRAGDWFYYTHYDPQKPLVGVSREYDALMVQGIRVEPVNTDTHLLFGYSTFDKNALNARDRNKYTPEFLDSVKDFWLHAPRHTIGLYFDAMESRHKGNDKYSSYEVRVFAELLQMYPSEDGRSPTAEELKRFRKDVLAEVVDRTLAGPFQRLYFKRGQERFDFQFYLDPDVIVVDANKWRLNFDDEFLEEELGERFVSRDELRSKLGKNKHFGINNELSEDEKAKAHAWFDGVTRFVEANIDRGESLFGSRFVYAKFVNYGDPPIRLSREDGDELIDDYYDRRSDVLTINWEAVKNSKEKRALERVLMAYILAHDGSYDTIYHLSDAQNTANDLIQTNWAGVVDYEILKIEHDVDPEEFMKMFEALWANETDDSVFAFNTLQGLSECVVDSQKIEDCLYLLNSVKDVDPKIAKRIMDNVFRTSDGFAMFGLGDGGKYEVKLFGFDDMEPIGDVKGNKAYYFQGRLFVELPSFDYVKYKKDIVYKHGSTLYRSSPEKAIEWEIESGDNVKFGEGYCMTRVGDIKFAQTEAEGIFSHLKIIDKASQPMKETKLSDGHIDTSVPLKYGKGNWDKPVRFFEDVVQNHLNAGRVEINFLLERSGEQFWVKAGSVGTNDVILGIRFEDDGKGYAPESLERMGRSEKDSPLDEGKYGEGTKMLLAAACRNQIGLTFDSYCLRNGELLSWQAVAKEGVRQVVEKGGLTDVSMAGFDLKPGNIGKQASATTIYFKDLESEFYKNCMQVVDPRSEGGGLASCVRTLPGGAEILHSVGPIKVVAGDKHVVYENGILMSEEQTGLGSLDVPDVSANRERDTIKAERLEQYVEFMLTHTSDPELVQKALEFIVKGENYNYTDIKHLFDKTKDNPINIGVWKKTASKHFENVIIHNGILMPQTSRYLEYHGYTKVVSAYGSDGRDRIKKACFPSTEELAKRSKLVPSQVSQETRLRVEKAVDVLADEVLKMVDGGRLPEAVSKNFVQLLRDKEKLHQSIEYSKLHPFILGEASRDMKTTISEYLLVNTSELNMVMLHEWAHHLSGKSDLDAQFVATLLAIGLAKKSGNNIVDSRHKRRQLIKSRMKQQSS